jgi:hypothetical protein
VSGGLASMPAYDRISRWTEHNLRKLFWVLLAYIALSLVLTWPLAAHFATHVPGDGIDDPSLAWNLWWVKHALVDHPQNPFLVDWQFWPVGINLAFYTLTVLNGMLGIPLQVVFGVIPTYNLLLLASFVLSGFGAYLLCLDFIGGGRRAKDDGSRDPVGRRSSVVGPFIGGALFAFASAKLFYAALGQGNIASSQWVPFAALYIVRAMRPQGRLRDAVLAALFIVLQAYAELTFASFLAIFAGLAVLFRISDFGFRIWREKRGGSVKRQTSRITRHSLIVRFALIAALCAIGIAPILATMLPDLRAEGDFFTSGGGFADLFSADLAGYTLPTQLHPVLGGLIRSVANNSAPRPDGSQFPVNKGQQIYVGYVALALAAVGLWSGRRRSETWFWAFSALVFFLLTLGPSLRVAGYDLGVPLPFDLIARLPLFKGNRYPSRYSVMLLLSLAPLVALGGMRIAECGLRIANRCRSNHHATRNTQYAPRSLVYLSVCLLVFLLLFEHLSTPLPLSDLRVPALYDQIAAEAGDFAVLELPPGWRNGARVAGKQDIVIMQQLWNQTSHGKRLLGGNTSRNPEFKFQFFSEDPTLARLIALTNAADVPQHEALRATLAANPITPAEAQRARDWAATWAIRYIMVHRDKLPPATEEALRQLLTVTLVGESGDLALYRVADELAPPTRFPVGTDAGRMILAEGWSPPGLGAAVYAQRDEARLLLPLGPQARQLQLDMWALAPKQSVTLIVDGQPVATQPLSTERSLLTFDLPSDPARPPLSDVRLRFAVLAPVAQAAGSAQAAKQTGIPGVSSLVVRSAGQETGDFAHIFADGADLSPNRRGYNLVAWNPGDGRLLGADAFDTHGDPTASARLAAWIAGLSPGAVVAGAVRDEASMNLGPDAIDALRSLGVAADLRNHFRWGHAFIGAAGATPGSAHEQASGLSVAQVAAGLPITAPQVAAALVEAAIVK